MMISFCIPVHNAKAYLKPCIESIYEQNITQFEIICIDDCSTDGSYELLMELSEIYPELIVIRNETNRGASFSRNRALKMCRGKYVWFVDADDILVPDTAGFYWDIAEHEAADAVLGNVISFMDGSAPVAKKETKEYHSVSFSDPDAYYQKRPSGYPIFGVWLGLFNVSFLLENEILFREDLVVYEDMTFYFELGIASNKVILVDHYGYYYRVRENSVSHGYHISRIKTAFECSKKCLAIYEEYKARVTPDLQDSIDIHIFMMKRLSTRCLSKTVDDAYVKQGIKYLKKRGWFPYKYDKRGDFSEKVNWKVQLFRIMLSKDITFWIAWRLNVNRLKKQ